MAWYGDTKKVAQVARDKDVATAQQDEREAAKDWVARETTAPERVAVRRAITKGLFTAGAGLLKGRPRKGGKATVRYERAAAA